MKAVAKTILSIGKLSLPLELYKATDSTISVRASEMAKINGKLYKVQKKPYVVLETGEEKDIQPEQILKSYEKEDGSMAIFTKSEQTQLLKRGSSREWKTDIIISKDQFNELSFQKEYVAFVELDSKKDLINKKNLKFLKMFKEGLQDKAVIVQALFKNTQYPIAISNFGDKLLVRFLHYSHEIRNIETEALPKLTKQETDQARAFITQYLKSDFDLSKFENTTERKVMEIINSRGTEVKEIKVEELITAEENPFI